MEKVQTIDAQKSAVSDKVQKSGTYSYFSLSSSSSSDDDDEDEEDDDDSVLAWP